MAFKHPSKPPFCSPLHASALIIATLCSAQIQAAPSGGQIAGGAGSITQAANETTIVQDSQRLAINWDSFNVGSDEQVRFVQPGRDAIALNRILSNDASQILGRLEANGHVFLVNPNGVIFGEGATVDVGGLVAAGLDIKVKDFLDGDLSFQAKGSDGSVINHGLISAAVGGNVVLLGQRVVNDGVIEANLGSVALAAGKAAVLTFEPNGLIGVRVTKAIQQSVLGDEPAVLNSGNIQARSGRVLLTASASADVFSQAVNSGDMAYDSEVVIYEDGSFTLGKGADLVSTGEIDSITIIPTNGEPATHSAGSVAILGENVRLSGWVGADDYNGNTPTTPGDVVVVAKDHLIADRASIGVSAEEKRAGVSGAGVYSGEVSLLGRRVDLINQSSVDVHDGGSLQIGGEGNGNGIESTAQINIDDTFTLIAWGDGSAKIWSSQSASVDGEFQATGSEGGSVEITSLGTLGVGANISTQGYGVYGDVIIQAPNLFITEQATPTSIGEVSFQRLVTNNNLTLKAAGNIEFGTPERGVAIATSGSFSDTNYGHRLSLEAGGDVLLRESYVRLSDVDTAVRAGGAVVIDRSRLLAPRNALTITAAGAIDSINSSIVEADILSLNPFTDPLSADPAGVNAPVSEPNVDPLPEISDATPTISNASTVTGLTGGKIVGGSGSIAQTANATTITQDSQRLAINWDRFNIAADQRVQFIQPDADSIALNRILSCDATQIFGQLDANGHVVLVNPNGVIFGESATVDVGGLVASGLDISTSDFLAGNLAFSAKNRGNAAVLNHGTINAAAGGNVVLMGKRVANSGLISADYGNVALAAGKAAVLTFELNGLLGVRVSDGILQQALGENPAVANSGDILARNGRILLTASESRDVFSSAVNSGAGADQSTVLVHSDDSFTLGRGARLVNTGSVDSSRHPNDESTNAGSIVVLADDILHSGVINADAGFQFDAGTVVLAASNRVSMQADGTILASGWSDSFGGAVALLGKDISLTDNARIFVGEEGSAIIGAKARAADSTLVDTHYVLMGENTYVSASGRYYGGNIKSWSKIATQIDGGMVTSAIYPGAIEIVTEGTLGFTGTAAINSDGREGGAPGSLLLQAPDLAITAERRATTIHDEALNSALTWGHVTLQSQNDIVFGGSDLITALVANAPPPTYDISQQRSLTLNAERDVIFDNAFITSPELDLEIAAGRNVAFTDTRMRVTGDRRGLAISAGNDVEFVDSSISWPWNTFIAAGGVVSNQNSTPFADYVDFGDGTVVVTDDVTFD